MAFAVAGLMFLSVLGVKIAKAAKVNAAKKQPLPNTVNNRPTFEVLEFDSKAIKFASQGNPSFSTFKNRLFAKQSKVTPNLFDEGFKELILAKKNPYINGQKVILHHPAGRIGANLYSVVGVTYQQHAIIGYQKANWLGVLYNLGRGMI